MSDLSILSLIAHAGPLVKGIMLALVLASMVSWTLIFQKFWTLKRLNQEIESFETTFWSGIDLGKLYSKLQGQRAKHSCMETIFLSGFKEFARLYKQGLAPDVTMNASQRMLRVALNKEIDSAESQLNYLATIGSVSPYVGLFGTVWGIMTSFQALGTAQQATLAMVAPGISEALVATAMGLFAAIPAVIAYNRYTHKVQYLVHRYSIFAEELLGILYRQVHTSQAQSATVLETKPAAGINHAVA